jgi:hypothetical protein
MKFVLAWTVLLHIALASVHSDHYNLERLEPSHESTEPSTSDTSKSTRNVVAAETENTSATTAAKKGDDLPPGTQLYIAWATDMMNDSQTNETRVWLESIVKDKSRIRERKSFPQIPEDELQKRYDSGRWGEDVDDYQKTISWTGLVLDDKGFNMVQEKKEWI